MIVTKLGARRPADGSWQPASSPQELIAGVHDNLLNLGLDALDIVNYRAMGSIHGPKEGSIAEPVAVLADLQRQGSDSPRRREQRHGHPGGRGAGDRDIVCVQNNYNLANRQDDPLIDDLARQGIAYVPFFPLGGFTPLQSSTLIVRRGPTRSQADAGRAGVAAASVTEYPADSRHVLGWPPARESGRRHNCRYRRKLWESWTGLDRRAAGDALNRLCRAVASATKTPKLDCRSSGQITHNPTMEAGMNMTKMSQEIKTGEGGTDKQWREARMTVGQRAAICFVAGVIGALAVVLLSQVLFGLGLSQQLGVKAPVSLKSPDIYKPLFWGGLWGALFGLFLKPAWNRLYVVGFLYVLAPLLALFLFFLPKSGAGYFGLNVGPMFHTLPGIGESSIRDSHRSVRKSDNREDAVAISNEREGLRRFASYREHVICYLNHPISCRPSPNPVSWRRYGKSPPASTPGGGGCSMRRSPSPLCWH